MNKHFPAALVLLVLLACGVGARAVQGGASKPPEFVPDPGQSFSLDLDTMSGHFSEWRHNHVGSLSGFHAAISVPRIAQDPQWAPAFSICVQDSGTGNGGHELCVQILAPTGNPPLTVHVFRVDTGTKTDEDSFQKTVDLNETVDVAISWATPGSLTIEIGTETHQYKIPWDVDSVSISSSTGELKADPLVFGKTGQ
jgi:hypothetical protein